MSPRRDGAGFADDPDSLHALAVERLHQGRFDEAAACFEQALTAQPDSAGIWNNLGLGLLHMGRTEAAELSFRQAVVSATGPGPAA